MKSMRKCYVEYHLLRDGDRWLQGKIAEEIFIRVKDKLLPQDVLLCRTSDLHHIFDEHEFPKSKVDKIIREYAEGRDPLLSMYNKAREKLYDLIKTLNANTNRILMIPSIPERLKIIKSYILEHQYQPELAHICLFCLREGGIAIHDKNGVRVAYFCKHCLDACKDEYANLKTDRHLNVIRNSWETLKQLMYREAFIILSKLNEDELSFLYRTYSPTYGNYPPSPFDFIVMDNEGNKVPG